MVNIVIPMAGDGTRFDNSKYQGPKPLIKFFDKPMIQHVIESLNIKGNYYFLIKENEYENPIRNLLTSLVPDCMIKSVKETTKGPASSALLFEDVINNSEELIIANCDQIMWWDSDLFLSVCRYKHYDGTIVTYTTDTPKNSFALVNKRGFVTKVAEKHVISDISLNGIHYWKKGSYFVESANRMIENNDVSVNGEYYIGPTYNYMITDMNKNVGVYHIPNFQHNAVGVPEDLELYIERCLKYEI